MKNGRDDDHHALTEKSTMKIKYQTEWSKEQKSRKIAKIFITNAIIDPLKWQRKIINTLQHRHRISSS